MEPSFHDVRVHPGDVLLLDTRPGVWGTYEESEEFFVTSEAGAEAKARESIDWNVLIVIGAALGLGQGIEARACSERASWTPPDARPLRP